MRTLLTITIFICLLSTVTDAETIAKLAGEAQVPVTEGWSVGGDTAGYPFQVINDDRTAELLIFRSIISPDEVVTNEKDLRQAVDKVINDVILTLPEAKLLTNTGYFESNRVCFSVEFLSKDTLATEWISHRLNGVLYLHPDGHQILFTLWARAPQKEFSFFEEDLRRMQDGFIYLGAAELEIFGVGQPTGWYLITSLFLLVAFMIYSFRRKRFDNRIVFSDETHFWRCECGRLNHDKYENCRRCGRIRLTKPTV